MKRAVLAASTAALLTGCSSTYLTTYSAPRCPVRLAARPHPAGNGTVVNLLSQSEAMALLSKTQVTVGRPIDSSYVNNVRAVLRADDGALRTVLIPYGMAVRPGDRVAFQTAYLSDPPLCTYVPNLVTRRL